MKETSKDKIVELVSQQKEYFASNATKNIQFRMEKLKRLKAIFKTYEDKIKAALWKDLHKSPEEAYLTEISLVNAELDNHIKHLKRWAKPKRVSTPIHLWPSKSKIVYEPYGLSLIISPWNYPFQLTMVPLIGAISAGCCAILKPSPDSPATSLLMQEIIEETFDSNYISIVQGGKETNTILLHERFDVFFFTGSSRVGKVVMKAAAEQLIPVVLELGGKSPCIVDENANIDIAAKRITWGKFINAGQTCIAPDYLFAHASIKDELLDKIAFYIKDMYGEDVQNSAYYPRIVTHDAVDKLSELLTEGTIHTGGEVDRENKYIAPTIIDNVTPEHKAMEEEIFGPILPVLSFVDMNEATDFINNNEKPLAFYYFGKNNTAKQVLKATTSGGGCINDTLMHITNHNLPFGGVGYSGFGKYHGKDSFLAFSNERAIVNTPTWLDLPFKYVPFKNFNFLKKLI